MYGTTIHEMNHETYQREKGKGRTFSHVGTAMINGGRYNVFLVDQPSGRTEIWYGGAYPPKFYSSCPSRENAVRYLTDDHGFESRG